MTMMNQKTVRLVAAARQMYDGRLLYPGETFTASEKDAHDLCTMNFARRSPVLLQTAAITAEKREEEDADESLEASTKAPSRPKRRYRRRDMRAEK